MLHERNSRYRRRPTPTVDRMRQGLTDAHVVEWLALVVECHDEARHPGTFEDDRVFLHLREHAVTLGRRNTPELDVELAAGKAGRQRGAFDEEGLEAVEMRVARPEVAVETLPLPALALHMADEREGTGAEDVGLGELRVFLEFRSAVVGPPQAQIAPVRGRLERESTGTTPRTKVFWPPLTEGSRKPTVSL